MIEIPIEMIRAKRSKGAAFTLACDTSGLEDKEIAMAFKPAIDAGTFSKMKKGMATLDADLIAQFCKIVGNTIYPEWIAYQVGCQLVMIQSEAERRAEEAEERAQKAEEHVKFLTQVLQGKAA
jgi:hypothetical protein